MVRSLMNAALVAIAAFGLCGAAEAQVPAQGALQFTVPADQQALEAAAPELARRVLAAQPPPASDRDLRNLYQLQMVAGDFPAAAASLDALRQSYKVSGAPLTLLIGDEILTAATAAQAISGGSFESSVASAFQRYYVPLGDKEAVDAAYSANGSAAIAQQQLDADLAALKGKQAISLQQAASLVIDCWQIRKYAVGAPLIARLVSQDDERRYILDDVLIKTKQGATLSALVVRSRSAPARQPAAMIFTIYASADPTANWDSAKYAAARGYVGVVAFARGKWKSPDEIRPFDTAGQDAVGVIDWISRQPWSDGRVGMWGGSYNGFTQWAAIKHKPSALKTIMPYVSNLPGNGLPRFHNVFLNANYAWNFYVTGNRYTDEDLYNDRRRWNELPQKWFASGRSFREVDAVDGKPNPWLQRYLKHPSYDAYWQAMAPYKSEFAKIDIPILEISGYSGSDSVSDYYFPEHERYDPKAEHYLVIGPWNHGSSQSNFKSPVLDGYTIDPVAQLNTPSLTFEWFDYVFKGAPKPAILEDKVNYQVMGANVWRHAPSVSAMSGRLLKLYLTDVPAEGGYRSSQTPPGKSGFVLQTIDFADRTTVNDLYPTARLSETINAKGALWFISDPVTKPLSVNGQITGMVKASINKRDMDFAVAVYEIMPDGRYFNLAYDLRRASYAWDASRRRLLKPGKIETIPFGPTGIVSRQLSSGSRLLVLLTVNKNGNAQINYGTGKDVSDESITDAQNPLEIRWYNDSVLSVPVSD